MNLSKAALMLSGLSVTGIAAAHSDEPAIRHHLRSIARALARGGNGGGNGGGNPNGGGGNDGTASAGSTCAAVGSACCETKFRGKTIISCDSSYVPGLTCMAGVCVPPDEDLGEPTGDAALPPQCVTSRCGEPIGDLFDSGCQSDRDCEGRTDADGNVATCDICGPKTCQSIPVDPTCTVPEDFDFDYYWPCCGTCLEDNLSCKTADGSVYIF